MVPIVQPNVLATLAVKDILGPVPLQIFAVAALVTAGRGLTVTVIVYDAPSQEPEVDVGVTRYGTVPGVILPGLLRV